MSRAPARRILAYMIDYAVIMAWAVFLFFVSTKAFDPSAPSADVSWKVQNHLLAFSTLTVPVVLYFAVCEAFWGRTVGKALAGLRVISRDGRNLSLLRAVIRNGVKFLPWEVAHMAIWYVPGRPLLDPMPAQNLALSVAVLMAALFYVVQLFVGTGRTAYDQLSGTLVERNRP